MLDFVSHPVLMGRKRSRACGAVSAAAPRKVADLRHGSQVAGTAAAEVHHISVHDNIVLWGDGVRGSVSAVNLLAVESGSWQVPMWSLDLPGSQGSCEIAGIATICTETHASAHLLVATPAGMVLVVDTIDGSIVEHIACLPAAQPPIECEVTPSAPRETLTSLHPISHACLCTPSLAGAAVAVSSAGRVQAMWGGQHAAKQDSNLVCTQATPPWEHMHAPVTCAASCAAAFNGLSPAITTLLGTAAGGLAAVSFPANQWDSSASAACEEHEAGVCSDVLLAFPSRVTAIACLEPDLGKSASTAPPNSTSSEESAAHDVVGAVTALHGMSLWCAVDRAGFLCVLGALPSGVSAGPPRVILLSRSPLVDLLGHETDEKSPVGDAAPPSDADVGLLACVSGGGSYSAGAMQATQSTVMASATQVLWRHSAFTAGVQGVAYHVLVDTTATLTPPVKGSATWAVASLACAVSVAAQAPQLQDWLLSAATVPGREPAVVLGGIGPCGAPHLWIPPPAKPGQAAGGGGHACAS